MKGWAGTEYSTYRTTTYRTQLKNMVPIDELTPNAERSTLHVARFYKFSNWKFVTMIRIVRNRNSTPGRRVAYFWTLLDFPDSVDVAVVKIKNPQHLPP
nr:PREDICTED: uncharacterized protein LOC105664337 isoform X2 [Megachile rotundata]